jgi:hypothetical protein
LKKEEGIKMVDKPNSRWCLAASVFLLSMLCACAFGKTIYVDDDATGMNNGTSWENAYVYLQDALADANSAPKPVLIRPARPAMTIEIRVARGIYKPDQGAFQTPGDRKATFELINGVPVKGGYAGVGAPDPNARDIQLYETILSGDLNGDDVPVDALELDHPWDLLDEPSRAENSYNVVMAVTADDSAVLDGFTVTAGHANGPENDWQRCRWGAGLYNVHGSPLVAHCRFTGNVADLGGGVFNYDCNLTWNNCTFNKNYSRSAGGGILSHESSLIFTNCTFSENRASHGGGMCDDLPSILILTNCTFIRNLADYSGGAMSGGTATLTNCAFIANQARGGAGIWSDISTLTNCTFIANKAREWGGGMWSGLDTVSNCTFSGNTAGIAGGAIFIFCSELVFTNCTLTGNWAPYGNALASDDVHGDCSNVEITNCIFWGSSDEIWNDTGLVTSITISYSDIRGGQAGVHDPCNAVVWGQGNIDVDPIFADMGHWVDVNDLDIIVEPNDVNAIWVNGDYHLKSEGGRWDPKTESWIIDDVTSPCIDAGDPLTPVMYEPHPRGCFINMGGYGGTAKASKSPYNCP